MATKTRIRRLVVEVEIPSEKNFENINQKARDFVKRNLLAEIQKLANELDPNVNYIIDQIEIDLGKINFQDPHSMSQLFGELFRKQLSQKKAAAKVNESVKFENAILQFIDQGSLPWWFDRSEGLKRNISKNKFSQGFLNKIRILLVNSEENFFRLQNFLGTQGFDHFLKEILNKNHSFFVSSILLMEFLSKKTKQKWVISNYNKKILQHLLFVKFSDTKPEKKQTLLNVLKQFAEQTGQEMDELFALSLDQLKDEKTEFNQILNSLSKEHSTNQSSQSLSLPNASNILMNYLSNGLDTLPPGYADFLVLDDLFQMILKQYKKQFLQQIKSVKSSDVPLLIQRLSFLFNRSKLSPVPLILPDESYASFSEIISFVRSSQMINLLDRQKISSDNQSFDSAVLKFILFDYPTTSNDQTLLEQFLKSLALDFGLHYSILIQEFYLSFKSGRQQQKIASALQEIYNEEVVSKYNFKVQYTIPQEKTVFDLDPNLSLFQRESLLYFADLIFNPPLSDLLLNRFDSSNDLLIFISSEIQKVKSENFGELTVKLLTVLARKTKSNLSDWVENTIQYISPKIPKDSFDHQILARLTREQLSERTDDKKASPPQSTLFRYELEKELTLFQEESVVLFLSLYNEFAKNELFRSKFSNLIEFEKFLTDDLNASSLSDFELLIENVFSRISIVTQLSYPKIIDIVIDGISYKKEKTYFDLTVIRKYKTALSSSFNDRESALESDQNHLIKKGLSFSHRKMILFLFQHLEKLRNTSTFKRVFSNQEKILDFLAQQFKSFSSHYESHAHLMDRLASKLKIPYNKIVDEIVASIKSKTIKSSLDYEFMALFDPKDRKIQVDPAQEKLLFSTIQKQGASQDHLKTKTFQLFFRVFEQFKNQKNYNKIFPKDVDLAHFLSKQLEAYSGNNFEDRVDLLFHSFGQSTGISPSNLFVFSIEKLISKPYLDELSNRLLSKMILKLIALHPTKFDFGSNPSNIKNIDDLVIRMAALNKVYPSQFSQLVYYPKLVQILKPLTFKTMIQKLATGSKINPLWIDKELEESLYNTKGGLRERIRYILLKIILDPKSINSQQDFLKSIEEHLLRHDPKIIESGIINTEFKAVVEEKEESDPSMINKIVDLLSEQKEQFISPADESSFEMNQFEYLLHHKNDILLTNDEENSSRIQKELDNFELIISSSDSLLFFLKTYTQDLELLLSFTELGLTNEFKKRVNKNIDQLSKKFLILEKRLIELQSSLRYSNLENKTFEILLRALIFKNIGRFKTAENFSISDFTYGFFEHLSRERYLNIRAINQIPPSREPDPIRLEIDRALKVFTDRGSYFGISKKIRDEVYFKDLALAVLKHDQLPEWALSETFTAKDSWAFIISKIENQDFEFTSRFIKLLPISDDFLDTIAEKPLQFFTSFFQQIQHPSMGYDLSMRFQELVNYFSKKPWNSKDDVVKVLAQFVLQKSVWNSNSLIQFIVQLTDFLKARTDLSISQLKAEIDRALGRSASTASSKKPSREDIIESTRYFIELGRFPEGYQEDFALLKKEVRLVLTKNSIILKQLLRSYLNRPDAVENILKIISQQQLIKSTVASFFQDNEDLSAIAGMLFSGFAKATNTPQKTPLFLGLIHEYFVSKGFKPSAIKSFFARLKNEDKALYSTLVIELLAFKKSNEWKDSLAISKFLSDIDNIDDLTAILAPKNIDLERSEYYVEFGSSKYDDVLLSRNDLYKIFQRLIDQDELLIKKRLHQWGNSKNKIRRILKLYPENKTKKLFDFIHPDLASFLNFLDSILKKEHNSSLPSALGLEHWEGLIVFSFGYWSSKNLILYSLRDLIQMYLSQVFNQLSISKEDFLLQLKESTSQPLEGVKQRLIDWTLQLDNRPVETQNKYPQPKEVKDLADDESFLVENAGLILLWPFLSRLFDKLNLLENGAFTDDESHQKAILLSQYLVTGKTVFEESFLALNKIICGASLDMFVDINIPLEQFELDLCESLLNSVIKNWEKINGSSVSTLRETFLIREGSLRKFNSDYNLNIEKKTFDVLLNTLPWNIKMIQTSLMKNRILVDWI
jgi:hypothetical protein